MAFVNIAPEEVQENFVKLINGAGLLATGTSEHFNMMTISSGSIGNFFRRNVLYVYVRPVRYTRELMDQNEYFTVSFYDESHKSQVMACASCSGRDTDKAAVTGLVPVFADCGAPYFEEAKLVYVCRKIYTEDTDPARFLDRSMDEWFPHRDYHRVYVGEILEVLRKEG